MNEPSDSAKKAEQAAEQPARPKWRSLAWWFGQTPEQVAEVHEEARFISSFPVWFRNCVAGIGFATMAFMIAMKGWLIVVPTVGLLLIFGVHYLITGKMMKGPLPVWVPIAFLVLVVLTVVLARVTR